MPEGYWMFLIGCVIAVLGVWMILRSSDRSVGQIHELANAKNRDIATLTKKMDHVFKELELLKEKNKTAQQRIDACSTEIRKQQDDHNSFIKTCNEVFQAFKDEQDKFSRSVQLDIDLVKQSQQPVETQEQVPLEIVFYDGGKRLQPKPSKETKLKLQKLSKAVKEF